MKSVYEHGEDRDEDDNSKASLWNLANFILEFWNGDSYSDEEEDDDDDDEYDEYFEEDEEIDIEYQQQISKNEGRDTSFRNSRVKSETINLTTVSDGLWRTSDGTFITEENSDIFTFCNFLNSSPNFVDTTTSTFPVIQPYELLSLQPENDPQFNEDPNSPLGNNNIDDDDEEDSYDSNYYYAYKDNSDDEDDEIEEDKTSETGISSPTTLRSKFKETDDEYEMLKNSSSNIPLENQDDYHFVIPLNDGIDGNTSVTTNVGLRSRNAGSMKVTMQVIHNETKSNSINEIKHISEIQIDGHTIDPTRRFYSVSETVVKIYSMCNQWSDYKHKHESGILQQQQQQQQQRDGHTVTISDLLPKKKSVTIESNVFSN